MKKLRLLPAIPICCMLLLTPVSSIRAEAVTVDINDNYDAGLLKQENDGNGPDILIDDGSSSASSSASSTANAANSVSSAAATTASSTAAPAVASSTTDVAAATTASTVETTTTDLPRTGDDNRILITFIAMLASFAVFLTALISGDHFGKNA
ncbi:hypothetical protein [Butyrivibrio sp. VCD2006]|uniref:hypothetical protein n=1 Tax=Butyrivibrio sp. VCD2006 TaxID=1280664 RepID=UPI00040DD757|nr:hypothetical protein [Butyrivibrio sp. VCD2006]